jgi:eIF3 subunit 6 N terminal domain
MSTESSNSISEVKASKGLYIFPIFHRSLSTYFTMNVAHSFILLNILSIDYDLTRIMSPFLDPHMVFPLLSHLATSEIYNRNDIKRSTFELARKTSMGDFIIQSFKDLHGEEAEIPQGLYTFLLCLLIRFFSRLK